MSPTPPKRQPLEASRRPRAAGAARSARTARTARADPVAVLESKISGAPRAVVVALSGGRDSLALLLACAQLRDQGRLGECGLRAIHVDHGLQAQSQDWARTCRRWARRLRVPLSVRRVEIARGPGLSLEAEARRARYALFGQLLRRDEYLLTAHHLEDQAETWLLQCLRGAGVRGLAAMPARAAFARGVLLRPWLALSRAQLEPLLAGERWIEDPSNQDLRFDRNYLRQIVMPTLTARWPSATAVLARSAQHLGEARELLDALAEADLRELAPEAAMDLDRLGALSVARQRNALRGWLARAGLSLPDSRHLERIRCELPAARADAQPVVRWLGGEVRRFGRRLYALPGGAAGSAQAMRTAPTGVARSWSWRVGVPFALGDGAGSLRLERDPQGPLHRRALPAALWVRTRVGGESIALHAGRGRRQVKALLREARVLPWWRAQVPLIGVGEEVIAVGDLFVAAAWRAEDAARPGERLRLIWERPPGLIDASN